MIWNRLKSMKCPECGAVLIVKPEWIHCSACSVKMRPAKFEEIVNDLYKPKGQRKYEDDSNQSELNNL